MSVRRIHQVSGWGMTVCSAAALLAVLSAFRIGFHPLAIRTQPSLADEGTQAHVFQFALVALVPAMLLHFATSEGKTFGRSARHLAWSALAVMLAFGLLYYYEHGQ